MNDLQCHSIQTDGAEIEDNEVSNACYGAFFDPGVKDVRFRNNKLIRAQIGGWTTDDPKTAGFVVADDSCGPDSASLACLALGSSAIARDNRVRGDTLRDDTLDVFVNTTGTGNEFGRNECDTSNLEGICGSV
jgi:hypothetical protein